MICLSQQKFGIEGELKVKLYEAPYHFSRGFQRDLWINYGKPFFNGEISSFWKIYSTPFSKIEINALSEWEEALERKAYIANPLFIAMEENKTVGGVWMDKKDVSNKIGLMHIKVLRENRKIADPLLNFALEDLSRKYLGVYAHWGQREEQDNPSSFFRRHGFEVQDTKMGGEAFKKLK